MNIVYDAWAATMWRACWQGGLVVLVVWSICRVIPSMPARFQCWLWRLAVLKFMVVLLLPALVDLPLLPAPSVASPMPEVGVQIVTQQVSVSPVEKVEFRPSGAVELPSLLAIMAFLWIIGVGWSMARLLVAWRAARRLRKQSGTIDDPLLREQLAIQARHFGLRTSPALLEIDGYGSPMLIGILRPAIVIPGGTLRQLSPPELAMVLGHELAHLRRGDLHWHLAAAVVRALFFFHPLAWLSQRRLNLAQEIAADELAILRQHPDPVSYGKLVVSVIGKIGPSRLIPTMSVGTAGSVQSLKRRLVAMASIGRASRGVVVSSGIILGVTVLLGIVPWRLVAAESETTAEQQSVDQPKVIPPAARANGPLILGENQRLAVVEVWERKKGQAKVVINRSQIVFAIGRPATLQVGDKQRCLEITVRSLADKKPIQHVVEAKLIRDPEGTNPITLVAPGIILNDNYSGSLVVAAADGSEVGMNASISTSDTRIIRAAATVIKPFSVVKSFRKGDSITISEVKATSPDLKAGDKVIVKGHYVLSSEPKASLCLFETVSNGSGTGPIQPQQQRDIAKGEGDFELSETMEADGYLHVTFYSVSDGNGFGGVYFGTAKQMKEIESWNVPGWYGVE